eukprot:TRINITY_DN11844_c0_g1_i1.p1 TRINITY_DN11844_c0_g1~~TRINITY_DN11844_c0_g1_i1.p1  ORF type:complete len:306 (+),score=106.45 TRINITY_DN11844_c0_g1_i1:71-988(+)
MLRRTCAALALRPVTNTMVRLWRTYRHKVGELHCDIVNVHWSVTDGMLREYLEQYARVVECRVHREALDRERIKDSKRVIGRGHGSADVVFAPNQEEGIRKLLTARHVLQGKEILLAPLPKQPSYNFYIPNTHEDDAEGMDPDQVPKMAEQVVNMSHVVSGRSRQKSHTLRRLMRMRDAQRKEAPEQLSPEEARWWMGDEGDPRAPPGTDEKEDDTRKVHDTESYTVDGSFEQSEEFARQVREARGYTRDTGRRRQGGAAKQPKARVQEQSDLRDWLDSVAESSGTSKSIKQLKPSGLSRRMGMA